MRIGTINVVTFYQSIDIQKGAKWNPIAVGSVIENLTQGFAAYQYELSPQSAEFYGRAKPLQPYGVEQQAALVEDYFYSTRGIEPVGAINQSDFSNNRNAYRSICE